MVVRLNSHEKKKSKRSLNPVSSKSLGSEGHRERLRKRFNKSGRNALADYELIELLLTYVMPRIDTKPFGKALLYQFETILSILQQPEENLMKVKGIGPQTAFFIKVVHACLTRCMESAVEIQTAITGPEDIFAFTRLHLGSQINECAYALYLDTANHIVHHSQVATGTVDRATIYPREVLKPALVNNATGLVLIHNHPSGQPIPSEKDLEITRMLEEVAAPLGIKLIDHMIVTRTQAYSLKTGKLL
ncbi:MAG: DNA repair protein RadC [Desulfobacteraceae bacterium]|nr:MAG: DNA repair protein RadC [Desulfobacteraceae bacterium]